MFKVGDLVKHIKEDIENGTNYTICNDLKIGGIYTIRKIWDGGVANFWIKLKEKEYDMTFNASCFELVERPKKLIREYGIVKFCRSLNEI